MVSQKYSVLIIGCGGQGALADAPGTGNEHKFLSFAHAFSRHEGFEHISFYDINEDKMNIASKIWDGLCDDGCHYDVICIATPDITHYEELWATAKHHAPKLVICEKPIGMDPMEAIGTVDRYKAYNIPLMVNYTRRFIPELQRFKEYSPIRGECRFNRGWVHTATHAIDFFNMLGIDDYTIEEVKSDERVWELSVQFKDGSVFYEKRNGNMPVPSYYDNHMMYVANNAYNFLQGKEPLLCTGVDALKALEKCYELMGDNI
jgi:hypothetical protein